MADEETKLFIGGLSWDTNDESLKSAFEKFGDITDAKVIVDRSTGRSRGFGFVTFSSNDDAINAREEMNGQEVDGRQVRVDVAQKRRAEGGGGFGGGGGGGGGGFRDRDGGRDGGREGGRSFGGGNRDYDGGRRNYDRGGRDGGREGGRDGGRGGGDRRRNYDNDNGGGRRRDYDS